MSTETTFATQTVEDLRLTTRVAAAEYAGGLNKPATAVKSVVSRRTLAQGVVTPARKPSASASVPIASSPAANVAVTAETIPAHVNNTADSVRRRRITVSAVKSADNSSVTAARPASRSQQIVCVAQCAINRSVFAAETAENQTVESAA